MTTATLDSPVGDATAAPPQTLTPDLSDTFCGYCGERLPALGLSLMCCPYCAARFKARGPTARDPEPKVLIERASKRPLVAGLLSTVLPGAGQVYNGQFFKGLFVCFTAFLIVPWIFGIFDAAITAKKQLLSGGAILSPAIPWVRERR
jgi:TM2 domain-containing membrane protein YozV